MIILGIETSCDETAVSVVEGHRGKLTIRSHTVASQIATHRRYGGVVPEVAARQHVTAIVPTLDRSLHDARVKPAQLDAIAVTAGPGLVTSLRVGVQAAKTLSYAWDKPLVRVNHIEGHIYANWAVNNKIIFPALCLVVSGGHTELILMRGHGQYRLIGRTLDDASGEAFDKVAKLLHVGYPGGPKIQQLAERGNPAAFAFPRPMLSHQNFDFSFSGLKTSVLYLVTKNPSLVRTSLPDLCASFQQAVVDVLVGKTIAAATSLNVQTILLAGGVAANKPLCGTLAAQVTSKLPGTAFFSPSLKLCTDNASMIALAGYFHASRRDFCPRARLQADPNWELVR